MLPPEAGHGLSNPYVHSQLHMHGSGVHLYGAPAHQASLSIAQESHGVQQVRRAEGEIHHVARHPNLASPVKCLPLSTPTLPSTVIAVTERNGITENRRIRYTSVSVLSGCVAAVESAECDAGWPVAWELRGGWRRGGRGPPGGAGCGRGRPGPPPRCYPAPLARHWAQYSG